MLKKKPSPSALAPAAAAGCGVVGLPPPGPVVVSVSSLLRLSFRLFWLRFASSRWLPLKDILFAIQRLREDVYEGVMEIIREREHF